ncbi:MAG: hypothetical protein D6741_07035, partial [Planctomycetota bacterium]
MPMTQAFPQQITCSSTRSRRRRPPSIGGGWLVAFVLVCFAAMPGASAAEFSRQFHAWARFEPGAWKIVRTVTETFQQNRKVISVTETKTTLDKVDTNAVTLRVEVVVRVAGKRFSAE